MSKIEKITRYTVGGLIVVSLALMGYAGIRVISPSSAESSNPRITIFCSEFVPNLEVSNQYKKWAAQNPSERNKWIAYRTTICLDQQPVVPVTTTSFGKALIAAGKMALTIDVPPPPPLSACVDGIDNDSDGKIDFPADPGCVDTADNDETDPLPPPPLAACADSLDNDSDGKIDFPADPGCTSTSDTDESDPPLPPPTGTVALWVDTNGGTCVRSLGAPYADAQACGTFDAAWDAAQSGDLIMVKAGTYPGQQVTGNKTAVTKIIGEGLVILTGQQTGVCNYWGPGDGLLNNQASFMWLENVRFDSAGVYGYRGGCIEGSNVTYRNVDLYGEGNALYVVGPNFTWHGGQHGAPGVDYPPRTCSDFNAQPVVVESSGAGAVFDGITFNRKTIQVGAGPYCGADNTPHMENIRVQTANNVTVRNVLFRAGSDVGSGHIFLTSSSGGATISGFKVEDTIFEPVNGTYAIQIHNNVATYSGWSFKRNRFDQPVLDPGNYTNLVVCGNTGQVDASWKVSC